MQSWVAFHGALQDGPRSLQVFGVGHRLDARPVMPRLGPETQQCVDAVLSKLTGLYVVQVARSYFGLR